MNERQASTDAAGWAGGIFGGVVGLIVGVVVSDRLVSDEAGLDGIGYWFWGGAIGAWAGASFGAAIGLRLSGGRPVSSWAQWTAALLPLAFLGFAVSAALTDSDDPLNNILPPAVAVAGVALTVLVARWIASAVSRHDGSSTRTDR